jgi:hypothetical protein
MQMPLPENPRNEALSKDRMREGTWWKCFPVHRCNVCRKSARFSQHLYLCIAVIPTPKFMIFLCPNHYYLKSWWTNTEITLPVSLGNHYDVHFLDANYRDKSVSYKQIGRGRGAEWNSRSSIFQCSVQRILIYKETLNLNY